jgi:hypothetical protein
MIHKCNRQTVAIVRIGAGAVKVLQTFRERCDIGVQGYELLSFCNLLSITVFITDLHE